MDRSVAYAAYVLAESGSMDKSRLRYLHDDPPHRIRANSLRSPLLST
jgi:hypothetical protein